jgi:hypothetical protein
VEGQQTLHFLFILKSKNIAVSAALFLTDKKMSAETFDVRCISVYWSIDWCIIVACKKPAIREPRIFTGGKKISTLKI